MAETGYENAPATRMLATRCAVCNRPLVDAVSVETGIGPDCREKHGYTVDVSPEARASANAIVYAIAAGLHTGPELVGVLVTLRGLGFDRLADTIARRRMDAQITIETSADGARLIVHAPYSERATDAWRAIPGRKWHGENKTNSFPIAARAQVWTLLRSFYAGMVGIGPRGPFMVGAAS